jgi:putative oxidoreductase
VAIPVAFTMIVAYITAVYEALTGIFSDPDKFVAAAEFPFLLAALLVLAFGPGAISIDALIKRFAARARPGALRL